MKCRIDGQKCEAYDLVPDCLDEPELWNVYCRFGMYHDQNHHTQYERKDILVYSDTCIFAKERHLPPKELRDQPLFSFRQIIRMLRKLNKEANDVGPVERDV